MKRLAIALIVVLILAGAGYAAFERYKIHIPGFIAKMRDPIAPAQTINWAQGPAEAPAGPRAPNIIVILADDLGYNDISLHGGLAGGRVRTPNIDALAREGARVEAAYANNGTCSPTRAALMTGRYPTRFGFEFTAVPPQLAAGVAHFSEGEGAPAPIYRGDLVSSLPPYTSQGVPASEITIAEALAARDYHTIHIGKWHLGESGGMRPEQQGFAESLGIAAGGGMFLPAGDPRGVEARLPWDPIDRFLWANAPFAVQWNGGQRFAPPTYLTDYFTDEAVRAIEANRNRPFFLFLSYTAPHTPLHALREDYEALAGIEDHTTRTYGAMILSLDRGVGRVMAALKANGLDENTLVIFTSDNGGAWYLGLPDINKPFRGFKASFFEGGVRVPFLARWPGQIPAGAVVRGLAASMDIFATAAGAAGAAMPSDRVMDGVDLLPFLRGQASVPPRETLFFRSGHYRVVRHGDWKLQLSERPQRTWLFNLADDPHERRDLSAAAPDRVAALTALIEAHERQMPPPLWPAILEGPNRIDVPLNAPWSPEQEYVYWPN